MAARRSVTVEETEPVEPAGVNEVRLVGRVSGMPEVRAMPSGDEVVQLRVVVRRPPEPRPSRGSGTKAAAGQDGESRAAAANGAALRAVTAKAHTPTPPRATVDTIDVSCWTAVTRRAGLRLGDGDVVEVEGSLRRRFYRAGPTVQSRYDVVAARVRRAPAHG